MDYARNDRKCAFGGQLLFDDDQPLQEQTAHGVLHFADEDHRRAHRENWSLAECAQRIRAWQRPAPPPLPDDVDPITLEVVGNALGSVVRQMGQTMARTAYSPIFAEALDFSTALFDAKMEMLTHHAFSPNHIGSLRFCVPLALRSIGTDALRPGDVVIHNDPQCGAPHLPEVTVIKPIFRDGAIVFYVATIAHQTDMGGKAAGSMPGDAREIFQEGLVIPPMKLFDHGVEQAAIVRMILANVRSPQLLYGDLRAMCGSLETGERALGEFAAKLGWHTIVGLGEEIKNHAERRFRAELAKLPKGIFHGEAVIDDDGVTEGHHTIRVDLCIEEGRVIADFRGSSPQSAGSINCAYSVGYQVAINAILHLLCADPVNNWGMQRVFHHIATPGTIMNVNHPGAFNGGQTETCCLIFEAILDALRDVVPERCIAPSASTVCLVTGAAMNPDTREVYSFITWDNAGMGAYPDRDGNSAMSRTGGTTARNYPTEVLETQFPWLTESFALRQDSAGPGRHRGGLGLVRDAMLDAPELEFGVNANRGRFAPHGHDGGGSAKPTRIWVKRAAGGADAPYLDPLQFGAGIISPDKFSGARMTFGDRLRVETPGGGGWGDPRERDPAAVEEDLKQGYISAEAAVKAYGMDPERAAGIVARYHWKADA
jgi:N-methylhydantoinase B/oxoprolinase/acetone carboxylase alpha subunit